MMDNDKKEDIVIYIVMVITAVIAFLIGHKIGIKSRIVFYLIAGIEVMIYVFYILHSGNSKKSDKEVSYNNSNNFEQDKKKEIYTNNNEFDNPLKHMFEIIRECSEKLDDAGLDFYDFGEPISKDKINEWEKNHNVTLPEGYKNWLMLSNGFEMGNTATFYPLNSIQKEDYLSNSEKEYYIIGEYIGDGSLLLTDNAGNFYEFDHAIDEPELTSFEEFINGWIFKHIEDELGEKIKR